MPRSSFLNLTLAMGLLLVTTQPSNLSAKSTEPRLTRDGKPTATIVLAAQPTRSAQLAACELQAHIQQITGAALPIVKEPLKETPQGVRILIGESEATRALGLKNTDFKPQEYLVRFLPDTIVLMGRDKEDREAVVYDLKDPAKCSGLPGIWDEVGSLYAVYDFLERHAGVHWLNPSESGTDCPAKPTLAVGGQEVRRAPHFVYRHAWYGDPAAYDAYTALWPADSGGFKQYETAAYPELHKKYSDPNQYALAKRNLNLLFLLRRRDGGEPHGCNHSLYGYYNRFWEKSADPATAKLFVRKEPDWFAKGYEGQPPQMCYSSRGLVEQQAQDAREYYDGKKTGAELGIFWNPTLPNPFPVEPMDNSAYCKCPRCQEWLKGQKEASDLYSTGVFSDYFFQFVNAVAKELKKTHPDKTISTLAYASHAALPTKYKLEPNVEVQFCFAANRMPGSRANYENELRLLKQWGEEAKTSGRPLFLWLYDTFPVEVANNGKFHCFPGFFAHTIGEQFKLFHQLGYHGMFHCGYGQEVEAYVTFKLMDDPTRDVDALIDEYFRRLYGAAAEPLKQLYGEVEKVYCDPANYPKGAGHQNARFAWGILGTEERMARYAKLMERAKELASTELEKRRVALFELGTWNYMAEGRRQYVTRMAAPIPVVKATKVGEANGDIAKVAWDQAAPLGGSWYDRGQAKPSARKFAGRIAHDSQFLYLELTDSCDPKKLNTAGTVFPFDDWEIFLAGQRALPYRQYAVGPSGLTVALSHGEVNFRMNVEMPEHGVRAVSDISAPDRWVTRLALPLARVVKGGVAPDGKLYLNIIRVTSPALKSPEQTGSCGIDTWVSYCTVHEVDRLAEIQLQ